MVACVVVLPQQAEAQRRVAVRRPPVAVRAVARPAVVVRSRPAVIAGGYYGRPFYGSTVRIGVGLSGYYGFGGFYGFSGYYAPYYTGYYRPHYAGYYSPYFGPWPNYPYYGYAYDASGSVRTQVAPRQTEVFVDGYYAGTVDDFDGTFQRLHVEPGDHSIELFLPGHRPHQLSVYVQPGRTFNIRHAMEPLAPGEAEPARPVGAPLPTPASRDPGYAARPPIDPRGPIPEVRGPGPETRVPSPGAQAFGQLSLRVQPGDAEVHLDGERWEGGLTNERLEVQLGAGLHRLEIRRDGYRSYFTDVTILNGQTRTLNVALTRN
jgi:hypothetical protein